MNTLEKFLTYCRQTCFGGSSKGTCGCRRPVDCKMQNHLEYETHYKAVCQRIIRFGEQGRFSIAEDFSRFPAGRVKADGPHSGEHLREVLIQRLKDGALTVYFDGTMGYGSSFLQGAFTGLRKAAPVEQLELVSNDTSIPTEVWGYINE